MLILAPNDMPVIALATIAAKMGYAIQPKGNAYMFVPFGPARHCDDITVGDVVNGDIIFADESTEDELIAAACKRYPAATTTTTATAQEN